MSNNKSEHRNRNKSFFKCNLGSVAISFAIMVPAMFACMIVSIEHAETMRNRARLSEATNEASLAIIALNNKNIDETAIKNNDSMAMNYINYFTSQKITDNLADSNTIHVEYDEKEKVYSIKYKQKMDSLTNESNNNPKEPMFVTNKSDSYGNTKKFEHFDSFDIAFIADFSGSATCQYSDPTCNDYSGTNNSQQRLQYMKEAIVDIVDKFKGSSKFALVPYDIGVPVQKDTKNQAGGESYACSVMYKMYPPYDKIDYNFWANKNIVYSKWSNLKENGEIRDYSSYNYFTKFKTTVNYNLDYFNYRYYSQIIGPAKGLYHDQALLGSGLCRERHRVEQINMGSARYSCGTEKPDYPLRPENTRIIKAQYGDVVQLYDYMFSGDYPDVHYSFANTKTVNVQGTIDTLFSGIDSNTITFDRPISPTVGDFSPFLGMCQSPLYNNNIMSVDVINMISNYQRFKETAKHIGTFKSSPHLVPFSKDKNHNLALLNYLRRENWQPGGGTDTITALLRAVPVMAEGESNNKMIIIITDGKDDAGADILRDKFLDAGVCQAITSGLTSLDNEKNGYIKKAARTAMIHYIKLDPNADGNSKDAYGKWFTACMNGNEKYVHEANNYQTLFDTVEKIIQTETGNFINKSKSN